MKKIIIILNFIILISSCEKNDDTISSPKCFESFVSFVNKTSPSNPREKLINIFIMEKNISLL